MRMLIPVLVIASLLAGCSGGGNVAPVKKKEAPAWTTKLPDNEKYVFSVGVCGRTLYPTDAIKYATEHAIEQMAARIRTKVMSITETSDTLRTSDISIDSLAVTDEFLQGIEKEGHWIDKGGITGVSPGTTYVLMRMERRIYSQLLARYR
ncbi:hypothetical protein ACFL4W_01825 [Planctomycetota bacterium]